VLALSQYPRYAGVVVSAKLEAHPRNRQRSAPKPILDAIIDLSTNPPSTNPLD